MAEFVTDPEVARDQAMNAIKGVISNSFSTMVGLDAEIGEEYSHRHTSGSTRSVAGVIGWVGNWNGTGILECSPEFACRLANLMLGTECDTLNEDALDAVAEMTNIIFGSLKSELQESLGTMGLSIPTVVYGNDVGMRSTAEAFTVVPFEIAGSSLNVKLYITHGEAKRNSLGHLCLSHATA
jgi:CheY-specific phosphatase CheX